AQVREHLQQAQPQLEERSQSERAVQAHAVLEGQRQTEQQRELEERQLQERQAQTSQQRELQEREERDVQERQAQERQAQDNQQREQQVRQAQEAMQVEVQQRQAQQAQQQDPGQHASQQADPQPHAPDAALAQQTPQPELQQADAHQQLEGHNQQVGERAAHTTPDPRSQPLGPGDAQPHQAQEAARALERQALESRDAAHLQVPPSGGRESGDQPVQSVQADAVSPALSRHVQTQPMEMEQASVRQQDMAREQEAAPVRVMAPTTPASADPLIASQAAALTNPEQETKAEQAHPSDGSPTERGAAVPPAAHFAQTSEQSLASSANTRLPIGSADAENRQTQSTPAQDRSAADPGGALFLEETMRALRQLQQEIEAADREDERFHQEWREYRERGEPYPFAQKRALDQEGGSMD
ncbi:hypothetical protein LL965_22900, partial [Xanthomonas cassavae CFBP 4642]|nr:hypothetical protein [Xanthomonas cassavae CFBP 4642]